MIDNPMVRQVKSSDDTLTLMVVANHEKLLLEISNLVGSIGLDFPSIGTSSGLSELVVDVAVVLSELRGKLVVAWARVGEFLLEDSIEHGLPAIPVKLSTRPALVLREQIMSILGQVIDV